jgi:hypothetical protein
MSALCFVCPATGQQVATGINIDPASFASLSQAITELSCPHCRKPHVLSGVSAWLVTGETPDEWPSGEAGG